MSTYEWHVRSYRTDMEPRLTGGELGQVFRLCAPNCIVLGAGELGDETSSPVRVWPPR